MLLDTFKGKSAFTLSHLQNIMFDVFSSVEKDNSREDSRRSQIRHVVDTTAYNKNNQQQDQVHSKSKTKNVIA